MEWNMILYAEEICKELIFQTFVAFLLARVRTVNGGSKLSQMRLKLIQKMDNSDTEHLNSSVIFLG